MIANPLRTYLANPPKRLASSWAVEHGFSPWSVRHWARGDKIPMPAMQDRIAVATGGQVTPVDWALYAQAVRLQGLGA